MSAEPTVNDELRQSFAKGLEALSDKQLMFLAVMLATLTEAIRATIESSMAEIRDELAELRRAVGGGR
jgi:DNA anti-recombination protein RmuC